MRRFNDNEYTSYWEDSGTIWIYNWNFIKRSRTARKKFDIYYYFNLFLLWQLQESSAKEKALSKFIDSQSNAANGEKENNEVDNVEDLRTLHGFGLWFDVTFESGAHRFPHVIYKSSSAATWRTVLLLLLTYTHCLPYTLFLFGVALLGRA